MKKLIQIKYGDVLIESSDSVINKNLNKLKKDFSKKGINLSGFKTIINIDYDYDEVIKYIK